MSRTRKFYYWLVGRLSSDVELVHNFTGFGLYDREVIEQFRNTEEQYPYFRGLVSDFGYETAVIHYDQPARTKGKTKNDFFSLYDMAMLGITSHSKVPLRLATMAGFAISVVSLLVAVGYLVAKLMFWDELQLGLAPLLIGIYFFGAVQLFFIGVLGEYIGSIHTQVHKRPLVVEKERINFDRPTNVLTFSPSDDEDPAPLRESVEVRQGRECLRLGDVLGKKQRPILRGRSHIEVVGRPNGQRGHRVGRIAVTVPNVPSDLRLAVPSSDRTGSRSRMAKPTRTTIASGYKITEVLTASAGARYQ